MGAPGDPRNAALRDLELPPLAAADVERRPNFAVSKPDFIVVLWREPARAAYRPRAASSAAAMSRWRATRSRGTPTRSSSSCCALRSDADAASHVRGRRGAARGHGAGPGAVPRTGGASVSGRVVKAASCKRDEARARAAPPGAAGTLLDPVPRRAGADRGRRLRDGRAPTRRRSRSSRRN